MNENNYTLEPVSHKEETNIVIEEGYNISKGTTYLGLNEFLWTVVLLVGVFSAILGIVWKSIQDQISKTSNGDKAIYDKIEAIRLEIKDDIKELNNKIWEMK